MIPFCDSSYLLDQDAHDLLPATDLIAYSQHTGRPAPQMRAREIFLFFPMQTR